MKLHKLLLTLLVFSTNSITQTTNLDILTYSTKVKDKYKDTDCVIGYIQHTKFKANNYKLYTSLTDKLIEVLTQYKTLQEKEDYLQTIETINFETSEIWTNPDRDKHTPAYLIIPSSNLKTEISYCIMDKCCFLTNRRLIQPIDTNKKSANFSWNHNRDIHNNQHKHYIEYDRGDITLDLERLKRAHLNYHDHFDQIQTFIQQRKTINKHKTKTERMRRKKRRKMLKRMNRKNNNKMKKKLLKENKTETFEQKNIKDDNKKKVEGISTDCFQYYMAFYKEI